MVNNTSDIEYYITEASQVCELINEYLATQCDDDRVILPFHYLEVDDLEGLLVKIDRLCEPTQHLLIGECCGQVSFVALSPKWKDPLQWFKEGVLYCTKYPFEDLTVLLDSFDYVKFTGVTI
jgi:hypothetical protein